MPRSISWLPRLHEITRSVSRSVRSHYDRRDLETLFELQPRAAQKLLELLPTVQIGTSRLVEREILAAFLDRVREADNVTAFLESIRKENTQFATNRTSRKKVRSLVRADIAPATLSSLPDAIQLTPGHMQVRFQNVEELAQAMLTLARILENEGDTFAQIYEPRSTLAEATDAAEIRSLFANLDPR
jgi:hypothetical protein